MKSTAQVGALVFGVAFLLIGVLGLFVDGGMRMEADMATAGRLLGLFPLNLLHNLVHLAFGVWGLVASRSHGASRVFGRLGAGIYGALVVLAFISPTLFGLVPIGGHVIWLHALLAAGLAWVGFGAAEPAGRAAVASVLALLLIGGCADAEPTRPLADAEQAAAGAPPDGRQIFRHDDFGSWRFWTDTAQLHTLIETAVTPVLALELGLKVDIEALPPEVVQAVASDPTLLEELSTTRLLLAHDAVVGLSARVEGDHITRAGITCALCHSTVDDSFIPGVGRRVDGPPNRDLAVGTILSLLPGLPQIAASLGVAPGALQAAFASWPAGYYDARVNVDGRLTDPPVLLPPAYGLAGAGLETYTGEGPVSYWNNYVAVTQMRGHGSFRDPRLGLNIVVPPQQDEVTKKLPALRQYQFSLRAPAPPPGSFEAQAAARGRLVFTGVAQCASCHVSPLLAGRGRLHEPAATGMEPTWAERSTTGRYRATPLRGLWHRPPYFHDGSAPTLRAVVEHYDGVLSLGLTQAQIDDLVEYLKSL